jgi:hypothetical protein
VRPRGRQTAGFVRNADPDVFLVVRPALPAGCGLPEAALRALMRARDAVEELIVDGESFIGRGELQQGRSRLGEGFGVLKQSRHERSRIPSTAAARTCAGENTTS